MIHHLTGNPFSDHIFGHSDIMIPCTMHFVIFDSEINRLFNQYFPDGYGKFYRLANNNMFSYDTSIQIIDHNRHVRFLPLIVPNETDRIDDRMRSNNFMITQIDNYFEYNTQPNPIEIPYFHCTFNWDNVIIPQLNKYNDIRYPDLYLFDSVMVFGEESRTVSRYQYEEENNNAIADLHRTFGRNNYDTDEIDYEEDSYTRETRLDEEHARWYMERERAYMSQQEREEYDRVERELEQADRELAEEFRLQNEREERERLLSIVSEADRLRISNETVEDARRRLGGNEELVRQEFVRRDLPEQRWEKDQYGIWHTTYRDRLHVYEYEQVPEENKDTSEDEIEEELDF